MHQGSDLVWKILLQSERFQAMDQCLQETSGSGELGKLSLGEDEAAYICNYKYTKCVVSIISSK